MSFIRHRRATSPNKFECRNYDSKKNFFDTSAVEAVIKLVIEYNPEAIMVIKSSIYSVYNLVFQKLYELLTNIFSSGTLASFGQLMSENKRESLLRNYDLYEYGYYIIITFVYGVSASMILPFVSVYTKKYTDIPYVDVKLAVLFMLIGFANNIRIPCLTRLNCLINAWCWA